MKNLNTHLSIDTLYRAVWVLILFLFSSALYAQTSTQMSFSYTQNIDGRNSAGVYDATGALIRTLWSAQPQVAGNYQGLWDGKTDTGSAAVGGPFTIQVLTNNENPVWEGGIGATDSSWTSPNTWNNFGSTSGLMKTVWVGGRGFTVAGRSEGEQAIGYINGNDVNTWHSINSLYVSSFIFLNDADTDGDRLYATNMGGFSTCTDTIVFDAHNGSVAQFTNPETLPSPMCDLAAYFGGNVTPSQRIPISPIDIHTTAPAGIPSAIAVQTAGNILAIAHSPLSVINLFDKISGSSLGSISIAMTSPNTSMRFTNAGLWVITTSGLRLITGVGSTNTVTAPISGLSNPVAVAVNRSTNHLFVLDGGSSQQMKEYDTSFNLVRTYGRLGGYTLDFDPTITNDKFQFDNTAMTGQPTQNTSAISVNDDNEVFLTDGGNGGRVIHISATNQYLNYIVFEKQSYQVGISHSDPTRVFHGALEYQVDYSKPLQPGDPSPAAGGNNSWQLVKNWNIGMNGANGSPPFQFSAAAPSIGFVEGETLSNGKFYAQAGNTTTTGGLTTGNYLFELPPTGPARYTGIFWDFNTNFHFMGAGGTLAYETTSGNTQTVFTCPLSGFSGSNPTWGTCTASASVTINPATDPSATNGGWSWKFLSPWFPTTAGVWGAYQTDAENNPCVDSNFPHIGGMIAGRSTYTFKVMPEKNLFYPDFKGSFPCNTGFGGHAGTSLVTQDHHIFAFYDGQYATSGEFTVDYWENGLLVSEFGKLSPFPSADTGLAFPIPASGGNIANFVTTRVGSIIYGYMPNEAAGLVPLQRWKIDDSSVVIYAGTGNLGQGISLIQTYP